jgi:transcriptional regulator with XRE-family HTH domain
MAALSNIFASNLIYLREKNNKTQSDIAIQVDRGHTTIGNWENGKTFPTIDEALILSQYFEISLNDLVLTDLKNAGDVKKNEIKKTSRKAGKNVGKHAGKEDIYAHFAFISSEHYVNSMGDVHDLENRDVKLLLWLLKNEDKVRGKDFASFQLPELGEGMHIRIPVVAENMLFTIEKFDKLVATYLTEPATSLESGNIYLLIDRENNLTCHRVYKDENGEVELRSDNEAYKTFKARLNDFKAVFEVVEIHSRHLLNKIRPK